uniref:CSON006174 protein n=1 Tax=Culicoides sonorensis TaxID=179676 RepID=A0A336KL61_CULSO
MIDFGQFCVYVVIAQLLRYAVPWLYTNFIGPHFFGGKINFRKYGEWAIVTGSSDGIGKEFAKQLASKGMNVVLISRSLKKLEAVSNEITKKFKVKTLIIDVDFTKGLGIYDTIQQKIKNLDIGVLVNNVGTGYPGPFQFHELAERENFLWDMVAINVISISFMTKLVVNGMLKKKNGLILNISSMAATIPLPICLYSATKAYVDKFTQDFNIEYQGRGMRMQSINPGPVKTNLWTVEGEEWLKPNAETFVASAMRSIGMGTHTFGYYVHTLMVLGAKFAYFCSPYLYKKAVWANYGKIKHDI